MMENVQISMERGQKVDEGLEKAEALLDTSVSYKRQAKNVERAMCMRKWKIIGLAVLILALLIVFIILVTPNKKNKNLL